MGHVTTAGSLTALKGPLDCRIKLLIRFLSPPGALICAPGGKYVKERGRSESRGVGRAPSLGEPADRGVQRSNNRGIGTHPQRLRSRRGGKRPREPERGGRGALRTVHGRS